jgi:hypothetical protein
VVAGGEPDDEFLEEPLEHAAKAAVALMTTTAAFIVRIT